MIIYSPQKGVIIMGDLERSIDIIKPKFKNSDSLKAYIKYVSKKTGVSSNNCYTYFFGRDFLKKLSLFNYGDILLKGSFSQFVHLGTMSRITTDLDFVTTSQDGKAFVNLTNVIKGDFKDNIIYKLSKKPVITDTGIIKIKLYACFGDIIQPLSMDILYNSNRNYEITYKPVPIFFDCDDIFYVNTPSHEEHLAEKLCIIAENKKIDVLNTRIKDFYDIYVLHNNGKYDRNKFAQYFEMSIIDRGKINIDQLSTDHLDNEFINKHEYLWDLSAKKYEFIDKSIDFKSALYYSKAVLNEQIHRIEEKKENGTIYQGRSKVYRA
jgi:hypothetical protein